MTRVRKTRILILNPQELTAPVPEAFSLARLHLQMKYLKRLVKDDPVGRIILGRSLRSVQDAIEELREPD